VKQFDALKLKNLAGLRLEKSVRINCTAWNDKRTIVKYASLQEVFDNYFDARLPFYALRKEAMLKEYRDEQKFLRNKARFIQYLIDEKLSLSVDEHLMYDVLEEMGFDQIVAKGNSKKKAKEEDGEDEEEDSKESKETKVDVKDRKRGYWYLLKIPMIQQTEGYFRKLQNKCTEIDQLIAKIESKTVQAMWIDELDELLEKMQALEAHVREDKEKELAAKRKTVLKQPKKSSYNSDSKSESKVKIVPKVASKSDTSSKSLAGVKRKSIIDDGETKTKRRKVVK
jgi:DNA topoisomerase-2